MALTTVVRGRAYDWSHAIGRGSASGTGFNYPQTMCLGNDSDIYVANRGNENNFGMRVNRVRLGGAGDEELLAEFFKFGEGDGQVPLGRSASQWTGRTASMPRTNGPTPSRCLMPTASSCASGARPAAATASCCVRRAWCATANGNIIVVDSGNNRLQVFTPEGKFVAKYGKAGSGDGEFNQPWGSRPIRTATSTLRTGRTTASRSCRQTASSL